jgi:hypothetical protein
MNEKWWGYLLEDGSIRVKRFHGNPADYKSAAFQNKSIVSVVEPFRANSKDDAIRMLESRIAVHRKK